MILLVVSGLPISSPPPEDELIDDDAVSTAVPDSLFTSKCDK